MILIATPHGPSHLIQSGKLARLGDHMNNKAFQPSRCPNINNQLLRLCSLHTNVADVCGLHESTLFLSHSRQRPWPYSR